jgi:hypothetical protein
MLEEGFEEAIVEIDRTNPKMIQQREQKHPPLTVIAAEVEILFDYDDVRGSTGKFLNKGEVVDVLEIRTGEILGYLGEGAGLLTQGVPGVPPDPFAPRRGPLGSSPDRESATGNAPARVPGPLGSNVRTAAAH